MCENCFTSLINRFDSQKDFEDFEDVIRQKITDKKIQMLQRHNEVKSIMDPTEIYKCNSCGQVWSLSVPELYWRGFFMPTEMADTYVAELRRKDRIKGIAGVTLLLLLIVVIVWTCSA